MVRQIAPAADRRLESWCYSCGRPIRIEDRTVEHVPARVFFDRPFPENLTTVNACHECNNGTSAEELYVACLLEIVLAKSVDHAVLARPRIARVLEQHPEIVASLHDALTETSSVWLAERSVKSLTTVVTKIARGHLMFDLADPRYNSPRVLRWFRLDHASTSEARAFEQWDDLASAAPMLLPEVGSRALSRMFDGRDEHQEPNWITVQADRYRYSFRVSHDPAVRFVLRGFLACEISW